MALRKRVLYLVLLVCPLASCVQGDLASVRSGNRDAMAAGAVDQMDIADVMQDGPHDFSWRLSGDRAIAPLQVFSSPRGIWLQFAGGTPMPAIFGHFADGREVLLRLRFLPPYVFIPGSWQRLAFRAGARHAQATKIQHTYLAENDNAHSGNGAFVPAGAPVPGDAGKHAIAQPVFDVRRTDRNLRRVLVRWAALAGWAFEPEHWALDADIPVSAEASLGGDFRSAVRGLMAATEMGDLPAQPCFYANKVLRVVGYSQQCDPRGPAGMPGKIAGAL